ncbi:RHS domain-containing protein [Acidovorax temperans]
MKVANGEPRLCEVFYFHTDQVGLPEELTNSQGQAVLAGQLRDMGQHGQ